MDALERYRYLTAEDEGRFLGSLGECVDCGAHEEQACELDCLTRRLATEEDVTDDATS